MSGDCESKGQTKLHKHCILVGKVVSHGIMGYQFWNHYTYILELKSSLNRCLMVGARFLTVVWVGDYG